MERGGDEVLCGSVWEKVTRELFLKKEVVGFVFIEGINKLITVGPDGAAFVFFVAL